MTLGQIIDLIARRQGVTAALVGGFVLEAIEEVIRELDSGKDVKIRGLGTFSWRKTLGRRGSGVCKTSEILPGWKLRFIPAKRFKRRAKMSDTDGMNKYGVELDQEKSKQASQGQAPGTCPSCNKKLDDGGACPTHGTEPLEPVRKR